jgi:hypothetical protein
VFVCEIVRINSLDFDLKTTGNEEGVEG